MVADVIGRGAAIALSHRVFHRNAFRHGPESIRGVLYVPRVPTARLTDLCGDGQIAAALCKHFHGEQLLFSGCRLVIKQLQHHSIRWLFRRGTSMKNLSALSGFHPEHIRKLVRGEPSGPVETTDLSSQKRELWAISFLLNKRPVGLD